MTRQQELAGQIAARGVPVLTADFLRCLSITVLLNIASDLDAKG